MESFFNGIKVIRDGVHLGNISYAIQKTAEDAGYSLVREFQGHGVGSNLHEEPSVPNRGKQGTGPILKKNMVIIGHHSILIEEDNWTVITKDGSLSSHYEHTIAITNDGVEILTALEDDEIVNKYMSK